MNSAATIVAASAMILLAGCGGGSQPPVPKPVAYPRVEILPQEYTPLHGLNVNASAEILTDSVFPDGRAWLTLRYPTYNTTLFITKIKVPGDGIGSVIENRTERMALNSGGNPGEIIERTTPGGFDVRILVTPRGSANPVQLLGVNAAEGVVVSATATMDRIPSSVSADSVSPVIEALGRDLLKLL